MDVEILKFSNIIRGNTKSKGDQMNFFQKLLWQIRDGFRRFMTGRYGSDKMNMALLTAGVVIWLLSLFIRSSAIRLVLMAAYYFLMGWAIFRMLSRNTYKRYQENRKYLQLLERVKDRQHRYYDCPRCRQQVRVPRGKGKIAITCPKCKERFIKKT